ncbi:hypothetical protein RUND412_003269 [Rhizina undulata]
MTRQNEELSSGSIDNGSAITKDAVFQRHSLENAPSGVLGASLPANLAPARPQKWDVFTDISSSGNFLPRQCPEINTLSGNGQKITPQTVSRTNPSKKPNNTHCNCVRCKKVINRQRILQHLANRATKTSNHDYLETRIMARTFSMFPDEPSLLNLGGDPEELNISLGKCRGRL